MIIAFFLAHLSEMSFFLYQISIKGKIHETYSIIFIQERSLCFFSSIISVYSIITVKCFLIVAFIYCSSLYDQVLWDSSKDGWFFCKSLQLPGQHFTDSDITDVNRDWKLQYVCTLHQDSTDSNSPWCLIPLQKKEKVI